MRIAGFDFPNKCPENCPDRICLERFDQGNSCSRCPIFNCAGDEGTRMLNPDKLAEAWYEWFVENGVINEK